MPGRPHTWAGVRDSTGPPSLLGVSQGQWAPALLGISRDQWSPHPSRGLSGSAGPPPFSGSVRVSGTPALLEISRDQWAPALLGVSQGQLGSLSFHPQGDTQVLRDSEHRLRTESSSGPELSARISSRVSVISWIGQHQGRPLKAVCLRSVHPP